MIEPKFGDVYEWVPGGQVVMFIEEHDYDSEYCVTPQHRISFTHLSLNSEAPIGAFASKGAGTPFSDPKWVRLDDD